MASPAPAPSSISNEVYNEAMEVFALFDKESMGAIKTTDLGLTLRSMGYILSASEVHTMEKDADSKGTGYVQFPEFVKQVAKTDGLVQANNVGAKKLIQGLGPSVLRLMEKTRAKNPYGDEKIRVEDLKHIMTRLGEKLTKAEFAEFAKELDVQKDRVSTDSLASLLIG